MYFLLLQGFGLWSPPLPTTPSVCLSPSLFPLSPSPSLFPSISLFLFFFVLKIPIWVGESKYV